MRILRSLVVGALCSCGTDKSKGQDSATSAQTPQAKLATLQGRLDSVQARLDSIKRSSDRHVADSIERERTAPRTLSLFKDTITVLAPRHDSPGFALASFTLVARGKCRVAGRLEVVEGGNKDVIVLLLRRDDFINWKNNPQADRAALYAAGPQSVASLDVKVEDAGIYDLVISNRFSSMTEKVVVGDARVVCIGSPTPVHSKSE